MNGLAPHTSAIFEVVSRLECIKPYVSIYVTGRKKIMRFGCGMCKIG